MGSWCKPRSRSERRRIHAPRAGIAFALLALAGAPVPRAPASDAREFAIVVSDDVAATALTSGDVRRLFSLDRRFWKAGHPVVVLLPAAGTATREFLLHRIYRTDEGGLKRMILEKLYQGEIDLAPKTVSSDREALTFVSSSRGAIAVVPAGLVEGTRVRTLKVDGKLPGSAGYPLAE
jgi:hypothetical protein